MTRLQEAFAEEWVEKFDLHFTPKTPSLRKYILDREAEENEKKARSRRHITPPTRRRNRAARRRPTTPAQARRKSA